LKAVHGNLTVEGSDNLSLPNLQEIGGRFKCGNGIGLSCPSLVKALEVDYHGVKGLCLPELREAFSVNAANSKGLSLPKVKKLHELDAGNSRDLKLAALEVIDKITGTTLIRPSMPSLKKLSGMINVDGQTLETLIGFMGYEKKLDHGPALSTEAPNPCSRCGNETPDILPSYLPDDGDGPPVEDEQGEWTIGCNACSRSGPTPYAHGETREAAIIVWNEMNPAS
jgi:hypothetical protein